MHKFTKNIAPIYTSRIPTDYRSIYDYSRVFNPQLVWGEPLAVGRYIRLPQAILSTLMKEYNKSGRGVVSKLEALKKHPDIIINTRCWGILEAMKLPALITFPFGVVVSGVSVEELEKTMADAVSRLAVPVGVEVSYVSNVSGSK